MPAMSHLMRPSESETSMPIMIGGRQNNRRQDKSAIYNFDKYLLAASPPINFAFSYSSSRNQAFTEDINNNNSNNNKYCGVVSCGVDSKLAYPNDRDLNTNGTWSRKISLPEKATYFGERNRKTGIHGFKQSFSSNDLLISEICSAIGSGVSLSTEKIFRSCLRPQLLTDKSTVEEQSASPPRVKKVSFADCVGFPLFDVRVFDEMPDTPSVVNPAVIHRHATACLAAAAAPPTTAGGSSQESKPELSTIISTPRSHFLIPNFSMPAANYAEFREKLNKDMVSLESVHLSDHTGALIGTVKVKDVAFDKTVVLRCTFDEWATYKDVAASYVQPRIPTPANIPSFATFSFRLELPEDSRSGCKFAVKYVANDCEYWDNNAGEDYELICPDWNGRNGLGSEARFNRNTTESVVFKSTNLLADSGSWLGVDSSCPYY